MTKKNLAALMKNDDLVYELIEVSYKDKKIIVQYDYRTGKYKSADSTDWHFYNNNFRA